MSVALSDLVDELQAYVPARDSVPTVTQFTLAVKNAAADFSRRCARQRRTTLAIVAGTAGYALPSDFLFVVRMPSTYTKTSGVLISDQGIVPIDSLLTDGPARWYEEWNVDGLTITFYPTPTYARTQEVWYAAGHVLNASVAYPDLTLDDAGILMLKAQALAVMMKANSAVDGGWRYSLGPETVDKSGIGVGLRGQVEALEAQYLAAVAARVGALGERGVYDATGQ